MIVKNEAHIVHEVLAVVAPHIDYWVVVDTGSDDGTQEVIRSHLGRLGIPGELHERPWHNFGDNRSEALLLAQGFADYIWVMDADDTMVGTPNFNGLTADAYQMLHDYFGQLCWRLQLFKDGVPWRYARVLHEQPVCDEPHTTARLDGDYHIVIRHRGGRSLDPQTAERDRDTLLTEVQRNPEDDWSVFYLAMTYDLLGDYERARHWLVRRIEMGGWPEMVYVAMLKLAELMEKLDIPWAEVEDAYLRAWEFRPTRAEGLHYLALHHRKAGRYQRGYMFAARAAQIPLPTEDTMFVATDVHKWRSADEQAICASWIDRQAEALVIWRRLLTRDDITDESRQIILANRDLMATQLLERSAEYPADLTRRPASRHDAEVTVSLVAGPDRFVTERTLNSFLCCCLDAKRAGRFLVLDTGLSIADRDSLSERYPFLEFITGDVSDPGMVREIIASRYWLHLWEGWRFFTQDALLTRLIDVLEAEPAIYQVGINLADALQLNRIPPIASSLRTTYAGERYVLSGVTSRGPAMFDVTRLNRVLQISGADDWMPEATATLDEVLCVRETTPA